ncbi:MAG TPA: hypothetical protein VJ772_04990 [Nitrososphaeraceae archaeon]|nr:hypothetical protein [Nitrososphaeraceae archaeon]
MVSNHKPAIDMIRINLSKSNEIYILNLNERLLPSLSTSSSSTILWIYFLVGLGVALQVGAANWDIIWHGVVNVESFFSPPHTVLYSGVGLSLIATVIGIVISIRRKTSLKSPYLVYRSIPDPLKLIALGCLVEVFSGQFDNWWHTNFGFDGLLSPPHLMLISGMLLSIMGALIGTHLFESRRKFKIISEMICYGILWMIAINFVFMFTLPFSEGQYFNFNPSPTAALILGSTLPSIFTAIIFYSLQNIQFPFRMTVVTATLMTIQSSATITSNNYFVGLLPLYLLNILIPISLDVISILTKNYNKVSSKSNGNHKRIIFSVAISFFFITLFFPWSVNMFKSFFEINLITFESVLIFEQILWNFIVPVLMPVSFMSAYLGLLIWKKFCEHSKLTKIFKVVVG